MALQAYFDESQRDGGDLIIAGYIASDKNWSKFSKDWKDLLNKKNLSVFKSSKMKRRKKDKEEFFRIIEKYIGHCVFCIVKTEELKLIVDEFDFPDVFEDLSELKRRIKNPYHVAIKYLLVTLSENIEEIKLSYPFEIIFDNRTEKKSILESYEYLKYSADKKILERLPKDISFECDDDIPALQASDLLAGELRQSHAKGVDLRKDKMFEWEVQKPMQCLYMYFRKDFFLQELTNVLGKDNLETYFEYAESQDK